MSIRLAGYGAMVIRGASETPVYLAVHGGKVHFRDASALWGVRNCYTVGRILRDREGGAGARTIMRIGRAGEERVPYACVTMETYRHFGRLGLGAVFGSKKLKALVVSGSQTIPVADRKQYRQLCTLKQQTTVESEVMKKYHELGTSENILPLNEMGGLPTRNLQQGRFEGAEKISGEAFAQHYLGRRVACSHCPVGCIHLAALRQPYEDEPYFYKTSMVSYDYEPIYSLGSMLGISEVPGLLRLMDEVEVYGLDSMSTGVVLAWATEAIEKGLIPEAETAGLRLNWGDWGQYVRAVRNIVEPPSDFYRALAGGVEQAAAVYGGADFALAWGGNEMPGYHTGPAAHIGCLVGARHSHLDNAGYSVDQKTLSKKKDTTPEEVAEILVKEEQWRQVLSSLVVCFFARGIYKPETVLKVLEVSGMPLGTEEELRRLGRKILAEKYRFKMRENFDVSKVKVPHRFTETPAPFELAVTEDYIRRAADHFVQQVLAE
ncbi:MAG: putative oxidoreductase YdhV [Planctomycetes bacterium ADurb.Bin412]|nr:MAG: putative oxidoreductase YdhV [Planctomycetes bacterium ADurb.Bin412]